MFRLYTDKDCIITITIIIIITIIHPDAGFDRILRIKLVVDPNGVKDGACLVPCIDGNSCAKA